MDAPRIAAVLLAVCWWAPLAGAAELIVNVSHAGKPLSDVVVVAVPEQGAAAADSAPLETVDQIDKEFVPYVKAVPLGAQIKFPNRDAIRHHVYSFSAPKRFELPLYAGTPAQPVIFDKPGVVKLGCNIHDWMIGYVYVAETPYFARTPAQGRVELKGLPAGKYRVRVWHPRMQGSEHATVKTVELADGQPSALSWSLKIKPDLRPRRMPLPGEAGYR